MESSLAWIAGCSTKFRIEQFAREVQSVGAANLRHFRGEMASIKLDVGLLMGF